MKAVWHDVANEVSYARRKFPEWPDDALHAVAIVAEESGELVRATLQAVYEGGTLADMRKEAIQTAAMAIRFVERLDNGQLCLLKSASSKEK